VRDWLLKFAVMHNVAFPGVHQIARIVLAVIAAVALAGCANSEAAKRAAAQAAFQAEIKADDAECQSYGAKPDTDAYVQCRLAIDVRKGNAEVAAEAAQHQTAFDVRFGSKADVASSWSHVRFAPQSGQTWAHQAG
jgi:glucose dehydrogenase